MRARGSVHPPKMRLRITRTLSGSIDGIQLDHFEVGRDYDVGTSIGSYLLAIGAAEPAPEEGPTSIASSVRWELNERRIPLTRRREPEE